MKSTLVEFGSVEDGSKCLRDGYFCLGVAAFYWVLAAVIFWRHWIPGWIKNREFFLPIRAGRPRFGVCFVGTQVRSLTLKAVVIIRDGNTRIQKGRSGHGPEIKFGGVLQKGFCILATEVVMDAFGIGKLIFRLVASD